MMFFTIDKSYSLNTFNTILLSFTGLTDNENYDIRYEYDNFRRLSNVIDDKNGGKVLLHMEYDSWSRVIK